MKRKEYVLLKPITIPAGTRLTAGPIQRNYAMLHFEATVGFGQDHCATFSFDEDLIRKHPDQFTELKG